MPPRCRWPGTADAKRADRLPDCFDIAAFDLDAFGRQPRLIEQAQMPIDAADPTERRDGFGTPLASVFICFV